LTHLTVTRSAGALTAGTALRQGIMETPSTETPKTSAISERAPGRRGLDLSRHRGKHPVWMLVCLFGGLALGYIDIAVVNVAIPSVRRDLHASGGSLALIVSGYTLTYAALLITGARLGDVRGRRQTFMVGLAVFTFFSLACGLAPDAVSLVAFRILQGVGAALTVPQVLSAIQVSFDGPALRRARAWYMVTTGGATVIGQALGGILVSANILGSGWRPVFLINVPIGALLLVGSYIFLPDQQTRHQKLDLRGAALLTTGLFLLVVPLSLGQDTGWPLWTWLCLGACVPVLAVFTWWERRVVDRGHDPVLNVALLARKQVLLVLTAQGVNRAGYFALLFVLSLFLQQGLGRSALYTGMLPIAYMITFTATGPLLDRLGKRVRRSAAQIGGLFLAAAFVGFAAGGTHTTWLIVLLAVSGVGYGAAYGGILAFLTESVGPDYASDVSGLFSTTLQVGGAVGVAVFGTVYLSIASHGTALNAFHTTNYVIAAASILSTVLIVLAVKVKLHKASGDAVDVGAHLEAPVDLKSAA
jgi:MFS family permease